MSYTMTLDMPDSAVDFITRKGTLSNAELGEMFVAFLVDRMGYVADKPINPFAPFCGVWGDKELEEFQSVTKRSVNPADWQ